MYTGIMQKLAKRLQFLSGIDGHWDIELYITNSHIIGVVKATLTPSVRVVRYVMTLSCRVARVVVFTVAKQKVREANAALSVADCCLQTGHYITNSHIIVETVKEYCGK